MDPRDQLDTVLPLLNDLVANLDRDELDAPTPCADFAVRDILAHMVGGATMFAAVFRGEEPTDPAPADGDLVAAFPVAMGDLAAAVRTPGALDRSVPAPIGEVPGETFARFIVLDGVVHGWDIATATGQPYDPPADLVTAADAFARGAITPEMRGGDAFGPAVEPPEGASPLTALIAFTGRKV